MHEFASLTHTIHPRHKERMESLESRIHCGHPHTEWFDLIDSPSGQGASGTQEKHSTASVLDQTALVGLIALDFSLKVGYLET